MPLVSFSSGQVISSTNMNANLALCVLTDTSRTITVTHTWSATQTFTGGWTAGAGCSISTGGIAVTGNSTITGTLTALTGITSSGTAAFATMTASGSASVTGTLGVGQASDSSIAIWINGALSGSTEQYGIAAMPTFGSGATSIGYGIFSRVATAAASFTMTTGYGVYVSNPSKGAGSTITTNYGVYVAGQTSGGTNYAVYTAGTETSSFGGSVQIRAAASKLVPGSTSLSLRNNADSASNIEITDAGAVTFRGAVSGVTAFSSSGNTSVATGGTLRFFSATAGVGIQTVSGSKGGNAALADLITKLAAFNLIVDTTT